MKKPIAILVMAMFCPIYSYAAISMGDLSILSKKGQPLKAEIPIQFDARSEMDGLLAGMASRDALAGSKPRTWEDKANLNFATKERNGLFYLAIESQKPVKEKQTNVIVGIQYVGGKASKEYVVAFSNVAAGPMLSSGPQMKAVEETSGHSKLRRTGEAVMNVISGSAHAEIAGTPQPAIQKETPSTDDAPFKLKSSDDLHFVVAFTDGSTALNKHSETVLQKLAAMADHAERVQLKGWAGAQKDAEKRNNMAFIRAFNVKASLVKSGADKSRLKIMRPDLSIPLLDQENDKTPRVVATLLGADKIHVSSADITDSVAGLVMQPVVNLASIVPSNAIPLLAMTGSIGLIQQ